MRLAEEVQNTGEAHILRRNGEDLVEVRPARPVRRRSVRGQPITKDDPLSKLVGSATNAQPTDASKIHEYLAEAYSTGNS